MRNVTEVHFVHESCGEPLKSGSNKTAICVYLTTACSCTLLLVKNECFERTLVLGVDEYSSEMEITVGEKFDL